MNSQPSHDTSHVQPPQHVTKSPRLRDAQTKPRTINLLSVVMPVRNEGRYIRDTLMQLVRQDFPADRYEILVADGMSDDDTRSIVGEMAQQYPQIRLLDNHACLSSSGRNTGFRNGRGDCYLVIDGHCFVPTDKLLSNVVACFEKSGADCLGRPQPLDPPGLTPFQQAVALARGSRLGHGGGSLIYGDFEGFASPVSNGAAYRKEVFEKIGYVDETFDAAEDVEFNYRVEKAGLSCYTSPLLTVRYYPREDYRGLFRQMQRYGMGRYFFTRKHPEALTINQLIPACFVCGLILLVGSAIWSLVYGSLPRASGLLLVIYTSYIMIVLAESLRLSVRSGWSSLKHLPLIFFVIHFGLGWGYIKAVTQ